MKIKRVALLLLLVCFAIYFNSLHGAFVFDDIQIVQGVSHVRTYTIALSRLWSWRGPVSLTYALNYLWGRDNPLTYHIINVLIHTGNCLLVYWLLLLFYEQAYVLLPKSSCIYGALLFSCHPLLSTAVSGIYGRSSLLCATFYLLCLCWALQRRWWLCLLAFLLAVWTKQEAITLPLLIGYMQWRSNRLLIREVITTAIGLVLIAIPFAPSTWSMASVMAVNRQLDIMGFPQALTHPTYFYTYISSIAFYSIPRLVLPLRLSVSPDIATVSSLASLKFILACAILSVIITVMTRSWKDTLLTIGLACVILSPLLAYALIPAADVVLENRLYIPAIGISILALWAINRLQIPTTVIITCLVLLAATTVIRNRVWATPITYWESAVIASPNKAVAHHNLGFFYSGYSQSRAEKEYIRALELKPNFWAVYINLSDIYVQRRQLDRAEAVLTEALLHSPGMAEAHQNLGFVYMNTNRKELAKREFQEAIKLKPDMIDARTNLRLLEH